MIQEFNSDKVIVELNEEAKKLGFFGVRHTIALMCFLGFMIVFASRISLSVAIVAMINDTKIYHFKDAIIEDSCYSQTEYNETYNVQQLKGEFNWSEMTKGHILGSFYYGYVLTNIIGGRAGEKWGGRNVAGVSLLLASLFTILAPLAARVSSTFLIATMFLQGLVTGVYIPAVNALIAKWYPRNERSKFGAFIFSSSQMGTVMSMGISGWICESDYLGGWPTVFYFFGSFTLLIGFSFFLLVQERPDLHPKISDLELKYILRGCPPLTEKLPVPWLSIFTSKAFWAIVAGQFGTTWTVLTLLAELPTYFDEILHIRLKDNGLLSALPFLGMWIFTIILSHVLNSMVAKTFISLLTMRKLSMAIASYMPALGVILLIFIKCDKDSALAIFMTIGITLAGVNTSALNSHVDITPRFAGTTMGLATTISCSSGFISPALTSYIIGENPTKAAWNIVFVIYAIIAIVTSTIYIIFITTNIQPWNDPKIQEKSDENHSKKDSLKLNIFSITKL